MEQEKKSIESYVSQNLSAEVAKEMKRAEELAKLVIDFQQNEKGEQLANIQTSQGFQEVWDYKGSDKVRWRLNRKKEQVSANYDINTHLFQKLYYTSDLLLEDERQLRAAYFSSEAEYNTLRQVGTASLFIAYFPLTYRLAAKVKPLTLALWTGAYYYGTYKQGLDKLTLWRFQSSLNNAARGIAPKYTL